MLFYLGCVIAAAVVLVPVVLLVDRHPSKLRVQPVRAGRLSTPSHGGGLEIPPSLRRNLRLTDAHGRIFDLRSGRYAPMVATGDSMRPRGIEKGSLVLVDTRFPLKDLEPTDVVALEVQEDHHGDSVGEKKLRLFCEISATDPLHPAEERICVEEYVDPGACEDVRRCKWTHPLSGYLGRVVTHFTAEDSARILGKHGIGVQYAQMEAPREAA